MFPMSLNQSLGTPRLEHFGEIMPQDARTDPRQEPSTADCFVQQDTDITYIVVISSAKLWKSSYSTYPAPLVPINPDSLEPLLKPQT